MYDVIIIGAGLAGCFAAYKLAKRKVRGKAVSILILEASKSLRRLKPCGGETDITIVEEMPELKKIVTGEVDTYIGYYDGKRLMSEDRPVRGVIFTRSRSPKGLDHYLPKILDERENVTIVTGRRVVSVRVEKTRARLSCRNGEEYEGKLVIDASGAMTDFYRKVTGLDAHRKRRIMSCVIEFKVKGENKKKVLKALEGNPHATRMDGFRQDTVGCFWLIYYDRTNVVNIGCGFPMDRSPRSRLVDYLHFLELEGWEPESIHNWIIPVCTPSQLCADRVLFIGDSVGMARSETGHGLADFLSVSRPLAETCVGALESENFSKQYLGSYQNSPEVLAIIKRKKRVDRNVRILRLFHRILPNSLKAWFVVKILPGSVKRSRKRSGPDGRSTP